MRRSTTLSCVQAGALALPLLLACATGDSAATNNPGGADGGSSGGSGGPSSSGSSGLSSSGGSGGSRDGGSSGASGSSSSGGSGSSGASGSGSGSSSGGSSSSSNPDAAVNLTDAMSMCGMPGADVISDFEEGSGSMIKQGGRSGWWYVFADTLGGSQQPAANPTGPIAVVAAPADAKTLPGETCNKYSLFSSASGHGGSTMTYAGVGASFVPGTGTSKSAYPMLASFDGIQFDIKTGASSQGPVYFEILTKETQPLMYGGSLDPSNTTTANPSVNLNNNRGYVLSATGSTPSGTSTAIPTTMTTVYVPFSLLVPRYFPQPGASGCGNTNPCQSPVFVPADALGFQFSAYTDFSNTGAYDLWIDNVSLYTGDHGLNPSNPTGAAPAFNDGTAGWSCTKPTFMGGKYTAAGKYLLWAYRNWQTNYVRQAGSTTTPCTSASSQCIVMSPEVQGGSVVSEGIAYGMLIAAYMKDQTLFDRLWAYWNNHGGNLMTWIYSQDGNSSKGSGSATDADEDAAWALHVASKVFTGGSYATNRDAVINAIWASDFDHSTFLPTFGNQSGNSSNPTNPSYFAPAYHPVFAMTNTNFNTATTNEYAALNRVSGSNLPPAWCTGGNCATAGSGGRYQNDVFYQYDAHRVPWRIGLDFCWNGSTAASGYLGHITQVFAQQAANGIDTLFDEYSTAGAVCTATVGCNPAAQPNSMSLTGTAAVGALAGNNSAFVNAAWQFLLDGLNRGTPNVAATGNNYYTYFNTTVGLLTALTLSGNFYKL
jgi:endo-1,4-beta-D-glucanase Y